jgi:hypothetical protein
MTTDWNASDRTQAEGLVQLHAQALIMQIIVGSMMFGVVCFAAFVVLTGRVSGPPDGTILSYAAVGMGALMAVLHVVIPAALERAALANQATPPSETSLLGMYFTRTIIAVALLEGAAFFSVFAAMQEHRPWVLGVTAVLLVLMAMQIPSATRLAHWLENRRFDERRG